MRRKTMRSTKVVSLRCQGRSHSESKCQGCDTVIGCDPEINYHDFNIDDFDEMEEDDSD